MYNFHIFHFESHSFGPEGVRETISLPKTENYGRKMLLFSISVKNIILKISVKMIEKSFFPLRFYQNYLILIEF